MVSKYRSLHTTINLLYVPVTLFFVVLIGLGSYLIAYRHMKKGLSTSIRDVVVQTKHYLDNRLSAVFEQLISVGDNIYVLSLLAESNNHADGISDLTKYVESDKVLRNVYSMLFPLLDYIYINVNDGNVELIRKDHGFRDAHFDFAEWRERYPDDGRNYFWASPAADPVFGSQDQGSGSVVCLFRLMGNSDSAIHGIILFNIGNRFIKSVLGSVEVCPNGYLALISEDGAMWFKDVDSRYVLDSRQLEDLRSCTGPAGTIRWRSAKISATYETLEISGWRIAAIYPERELFASIRAVKLLTISLMVVIGAIITVVLNIYTRRVTRPITRLTTKVKQVELGDLDAVFDVDERNEIGMLNHGIKDMVYQIRSLIGKVESEQKMKLQAEFAAQQAQITPHFLYNTLYSIKHLCEMNEMRPAAAMVTALSNFYRLTTSDERSMTTVCEEVDHARNYLIIQKMRYEDKLDFVISIDEDIEGCSIVKFVLQPLVENSIYHGIKPKEGTGTVTIEGYRRAEQLVFVVADDGKGMSGPVLQRLREMMRSTDNRQHCEGVGFANVYRRFRYCYGDDFDMRVTGEEDCGCRIEMRFPIRRAEVMS